MLFGPAMTLTMTCENDLDYTVDVPSYRKWTY